MIELTEHQQSELHWPEPVVIDPRTNEQYVLVRREVYQRMRNILEDEDVRQMAPLLADLDPEDWEDVSAYEGKP